MKKRILLISLICLVILIAGFYITGFKTYKIPTSSMENEIPTGSRIISWNKKFKPDRFEIIIYRFPEGDTVTVPYSPRSYYSWIREFGYESYNAKFEKMFIPFNKREQWVGRCVGMPGDEIMISESKLYVNSKLYENLSTKKSHIIFVKKGIHINPSVFDKYGINENDRYILGDSLIAVMTTDQANKFKTFKTVDSVSLKVDLLADSKTYFPFSDSLKWTKDFYGPLVIPSKNIAIPINLNNLSVYSRLISIYEGNDLKTVDGKIYINDLECNSYTPRMDYYFIICDNRDNTYDSRYWGFVPENHLVGKVLKVIK